MSDLAKFLYTHNPFYLVSAGCVLFGFRAICQDSSNTNQVWTLALSLAAYTLLLAATAVVIVRWGKVWEDARTVALLSILMCLALSSSFDTTCHAAPTVARTVLIGGWVFSVLIIQLLRVGLPIVLPAVYRVPLLAMMALFFLFPILVTSGLGQAISTNLAWRVLLFPFLCSLLILTLIPAARRGSVAVANNGSPWQWPLYPWSIFFFMLVGMMGRSYLLTISFQMDQGTTSTFAPYYLIPMLLGAVWVLSEGALASNNKVAIGWLAASVLGLPLMASLPGYSFAAFSLHSQISQSLATPLWLTIVAAAVFAAYFWWRGASAYKYILTAQLALLSGISSSTKVISDFEFYNALPLATIVAYQIIQLLRTATTARYLIALLLLVCASILVFPELSQRYFAALPIHVALGGALLGALWFDDWLAQRLRAWLALITLPLVLSAQAVALLSTELSGVALVYCVLVFSGALVLCAITKMSVWRLSTGITALSALAFLVVYVMIKQNMLNTAQANLALTAGAGCFVIGAIISAAKAGVGRRSSGKLLAELEKAHIELFGHTTTTSEDRSEPQQMQPQPIVTDSGTQKMLPGDDQIP